MIEEAVHRRQGVLGSYPDDCPEWRCPHLSTLDRRDGKTCSEHPCTCKKPSV